MPLECPRCLFTNSDSASTCECGYDLTPQIRKITGATTVIFRRVDRRIEDSGMTQEGFVLGIVAVWLLLTIGEWIRIRPELGMRKSLNLIQDSILLSLTDLAGSLIIGALGWIVVWIILSYEGRRLRPCPKRTTLAVTIVSAGLLFMSRWIAPDVLAQHVIQMAIIFGIAVFAYFAGCRGWLGKW
ncbi:MAG: hypothetical protein Q8L77_17985 [Nitrospirota bacterium]|nr:hypothetical protein [Nitrospirota bacterium]